MTDRANIGTRVSYEDMANPRREGQIVGEIVEQWAIRWDEDETVYKMMESHGLFFHTTVPKQMLDRAAKRQSDNPGRSVAGWNVVANPIAKAIDRMSGEWDENGTVGVHLPADVAPLLLTGRGWTFADGAWVAPTGERFWMVDEALTTALVAETVQS